MDNRELVFKSQFPRDFEKRQNESPNRNMMGFKSELRQFPKYQKLNELNKEVDSTENRKVGFYYEATRVLTALELPIKLRDSVLKNADGFYSILGKGTYHRGGSVLVPVATYLTCLERFIFRRRIDFYPFCSKHLFNRCITSILKENRQLRLKLLSKDFRIKTILVQLNGLKSHFYLNGVFFSIASENLYKYYDKINDCINTAITSVIFDLTTHQLMGRFLLMAEVCRFLGISQSTLFRRRVY